jgi:hypothetical protein
VRRSEATGALRQELEHRIRTGSCVYCRAPAAPDRPLTREHVIPRARGGRRKDDRIVVPACARCNHRRGCQEIVLFLLARPNRIAAFLDYLATLSPETIREIDLRIFGELYTALWLLAETAGHPHGDRRAQLQHLCAGRRLHRRRYAARRIVTAVEGRLSRGRDRVEHEGPTCILPGALPLGRAVRGDRDLAHASAMLAGALSLAWSVPAERVVHELERERRRSADHSAARPSAARTRGVSAAEEDAAAADGGAEGWEDDAGVVSLDGWQRRGRRRRGRVDQRRGRGRRYARGRAA